MIRLHEINGKRVFDNMGKQVYIKSINNQLFKLSCLTITNINIINKSKLCYNDIPIKFVIQTSDQTEIREIEKEGFLNADGFIVDHSTTKECEEHYRYININGSDVTHVANKNQYKLFETKDIIMKQSMY